MKPGSKVYYSRSLMGILAGMISGLLYPTTSINLVLYNFLAILTAVALYYLSILLARKVLGVKERDLHNPAYLKRGGLFTYILLWLLTCSTIATFLKPVPWP